MQPIVGLSQSNRKPPGNGDWVKDVPVGERYWVMEQPLWQEFVSLVPKFDNLSNPNAGQSQAISDELARITHELGLADILQHRIQELHRVNTYEQLRSMCERLDPKSHPRIRRVSSSETKHRHDVFRIINTIKSFSNECENLERRFFDLFAKASLKKVLNQPDPGWFLQQIAGWIHYPNCSVGGQVAIAAGKLKRASTKVLPFNRFAQLVLSWHYALTSRTLMRPDNLSARLNQNYDLDALAIASENLSRDIA